MLKKAKTKTHIPQKRGVGTPNTMSLESLNLVPWELKAIYTLENKSKVQIFYVIMFKIQRPTVSETPGTQFETST